ncbi:MAG: dTDP-4-dehydrorhamnose 3,5-epimerase [Candidatus Lokiarchaeota archaeon]|nr:dTDP-4-dehydrorhamnose 3,5-epimerase [Candidatus Lokiarchaeota archaeon]
MKFNKTNLKDLFVIQFEPFQDERGHFYRVFCKNELKEINLHGEIVQINQSKTIKKGSIRGMHFQYPPMSEIKMVKCLKGAVYDVAIDIRKGSPTLLHWYGEILSAENLKMMYIPKGFAHGFQTLEKNSELLYSHTEYYSPKHEGGIKYDDPLINIQWPLKIADISKKDKSYELLPNDFNGI